MEHKILVLGASGSGKTVYLSSLFHQLKMPTAEHMFYMETEPDMRRRLINTFARVANPDAEWPASTTRSEVATWKFTCHVMNPDTRAVFPVIDFAYLDYSGEILTEEFEGAQQLDQQAQMEQTIRQANALLVLVDGQKVLYRLKGVDSPLKPLDHDLRHILTSVFPHIEKPLHFVVTKWDILEGAQIDLEAVSASLREIDEFRQVCEHRRAANAVTRLIPISSVGSGFAEAKNDGQMVKSARVQPRPFLVEVPLCCVLNDEFKNRSVPPDNDSLQATRVQLKLSFLTLVVTSARVLALLPFSRWLPGQVLLVALLDRQERRVDASRSGLKKTLKRLMCNMSDRKSAIDALLVAHYVKVRELERRFPASLL